MWRLSIASVILEHSTVIKKLMFFVGDGYCLRSLLVSHVSIETKFSLTKTEVLI